VNTLNKLALTLAISATLTACTHVEKVGNMDLAIYEGAFDSSITGVTMRGDDNKITLQQVIVSDGIASILVKESAKVGAAATFGAAAAPLYKPAQNKSVTNVKNGGSNVSNNSGSSATNSNQAVATGASANSTGLGGSAIGGQGGVSSALGGNASSVANPIANGGNASGGSSNSGSTSFGGSSSSTSGATGGYSNSTSFGGSANNGGVSVTGGSSDNGDNGNHDKDRD